MCDTQKKEISILNELTSHGLYIMAQNGGMTFQKKATINAAYNKAIRKLRKNQIEIREELLDEFGDVYKSFSDFWKWREVITTIYKSFYLNVEKYK